MIRMSMIDWLIVGFAITTTLLVLGTAWFLSWAAKEIHREWTCDLKKVPAPSIAASSDGGTIL